MVCWQEQNNVLVSFFGCKGSRQILEVAEVICGGIERIEVTIIIHEKGRTACAQRYFLV
jgi:hypothetical protein